MEHETEARHCVPVIADAHLRKIFDPRPDCYERMALNDREPEGAEDLPAGAAICMTLVGLPLVVMALLVAFYFGLQLGRAVF